MLEGMYSAAAGMAAQQQRLDAVSTDLANVSTTGYKQVRTAFRDLVYAESRRGATEGVQIGAGAAMTQIGRSQAQGALQSTGQPLDVAIQGQGFLAVRLPDGRQGLTRDGQLRLDSQSRLVTSGGLLLDPAVRLPAGVDPDDVKIAADGAVTVRSQPAGTIRLVTVAAPSQLQGATENAFVPTAASGGLVAAPRETTLTQGAVEGSNVDVTTAMTSMIEAQRGFELASKAIQFADQMHEIANGVKR